MRHRPLTFPLPLPIPMLRVGNPYLLVGAEASAVLTSQHCKFSLFVGPRPQARDGVVEREDDLAKRMGNL